MDARLLVIFPAIKGLLMAGLVATLGLAFWESIVIAVVSATLTGFFLLLSVFLQAREARRNRELLHDLKRGAGIARRVADQPEEP